MSKGAEDSAPFFIWLPESGFFYSLNEGVEKLFSYLHFAVNQME